MKNTLLNFGFANSHCIYLSQKLLKKYNIINELLNKIFNI